MQFALRIALILAAAAALLLPLQDQASFTSKAAVQAAQELLVFIGTYTRGKSEGIYSYRLDVRTGKLRPQAVTKAENPSFLALHPSGRYLYAVGEVSNFGGEKTGAVSAFAVAPDSGQLTLLNQQSSGGAGPCYVTVDQTGRHALVANYSAGSVASLPIDSDGRLGSLTTVIQHQGSGADPRRQKAPHAHSINIDPGNRFAIAADLGADRLFIYAFEANTGVLRPARVPSVPLAPGAGPRHFTFHPTAPFLYAINELDNTVTAFRFDSSQGSLSEIQVIDTLPEGYQDTSYTAEVQIHPSGRFLYGSNRGHDSIVIFRIDPASGRLTLIGHEPTQGKFPRHFGIDPTGAFMLAANQNSDSVVVYRIDSRTGLLEPTGDVLEIPTPVCVKFLDPAAIR